MLLTKYRRRFNDIGFPDALVVSVAAHETMHWTLRPEFRHDLGTFLADTNEFIQFSKNLYRHTDKSKLRVWWTPLELQPGDRCGQADSNKFLNNKRYHDAVSVSATYQLHTAGWDIVDVRDYGRMHHATNCVHFPSKTMKEVARSIHERFSKWPSLNKRETEAARAWVDSVYNYFQSKSTPVQTHHKQSKKRKKSIFGYFGV